jgi:hypothetical protein
MSILLKLDSTSLNNQNEGDFVVKFPSPINLKNDDYELALIKLNLWYSWHNISVDKTNNVFRYFNGVVWRPQIVIPNGQYSLTAINAILIETLIDNGDFTVDAFGQNVYDVAIEPNFSTLRTKITTENGYQLDLTSGDLNLLLGCDKVIVTVSGDCPQVANINDSINALIVNCDIISGDASYSNSNKSRVLYSFVPESVAGTNINVSPTTLIYLPVDVNNGLLSEIRIFITDNLGRSIDFNGEPITYLLHLRKVFLKDK